MISPGQNTKRLQKSGPSALRTADWTLSGLCLASFGLVLQETVRAGRGPETAGWREATLVLATTASTLVSLSRQLPGQNVLLSAVVVAAIGGLAQAIGALTGIPFGPCVYTHAAGPRLLDVLPWWIPLAWIVMILNSRGVARLVLRPWRKTHTYGLRLIGLTAALSLVFDLGLEPFAGRVKGCWLWSPMRLDVNWYGTPATHFAGWALTALLILAFATPALINKSPAKHPPDYHPLVIWCLLNLLFAAGSITHPFWVAAAFSSGAALTAAFLAVRGARW